MLKGVLTVGGWTMASRVLGFARDMLIAAKLGAGPMADAFFVALKLPNLFRRLFGEGAFNAAFIPAFSGTLAVQGPKVAQQLAERMASIMTLWLSLLVVTRYPETAQRELEELNPSDAEPEPPAVDDAGGIHPGTLDHQ